MTRVTRNDLESLGWLDMTKMTAQDDYGNEMRGVAALAFGVFLARLLAGYKRQGVGLKERPSFPQLNSSLENHFEL